MALRKNETYTVQRTFATYDADDNDTPIYLNKGDELFCNESGTIVNVETTEIYNIQNHVVDRWEWYLDKKGGFNHFRGDVKRNEYVALLVRHADGFDLDELYKIAEDESFGPLEKSMSRSVFSQCLTDAVASGRFEMRKDGELVAGVGHNKKNCTFHVVRSRKVA